MSEPGEMRVLRVRPKLPSGLRLPPGSKLRVRIEDVSSADRPAKPLAEKAFAAKSGEWVTIAVPTGLIDPRASYSAFLHVDTTGTKSIELGDFISPAVHPVLTHGAPDAVEADMIKVGGKP